MVSTGPLSGLHVLDLSTFVAGPSGTMVLAQLGADVVRVDPLGGAPDTRRLPLAPDGSSLYWAGLNRHKRSVSLDLGREEGRAVVRRMLARPGDGYGILVTNAVDRRWLDYDTLRRVRPDLVMVHIAGRPDGRPAVDYTVNAEVGLPWLTGPVDATRPVNHVLPAWDLLTGLHAALSVVTADRKRRATGRGELIRINLSDVAVTTLAHLGLLADTAINASTRVREGNYLYGAYGSDFATKDGHRVMVVALTARHWARLVEVTEAAAVISALEERLGVDFSDERHRYAHRDLVTAVLAPWFAARVRADAVDRLERARVLWGDYRRVEELQLGPDSPVAASGLFDAVDHPGVGTYPVPRPVARIRGWDPPRPGPAAVLGEHTDQVLAEWLAADDAELAGLRAAGVSR
ncbi:CoA transferase [Phytohabitans sp. ZYX-F-186]|uniref:CoA transferase n=1 Tax=Phytohabitans maris TaxID=3071409 RepID=A0ABU0ZM27_9ACTN|nr:CoA transferase [Phytohabitans sp. ZYX-F-186]MDQ7907457.1 CoA transferase [Phytohabitans sp. ZYX-F-186]